MAPTTQFIVLLRSNILGVEPPRILETITQRQIFIL